MDDREMEIEVLKAQLAAMTQERDALAAIVWGKIHGAPPNQVGGVTVASAGQVSKNTCCQNCGRGLKASDFVTIVGVKFCTDCLTMLGDVEVSHLANQVRKGQRPLLTGPVKQAYSAHMYNQPGFSAAYDPPVKDDAAKWKAAVMFKKVFGP